MSVVVALTLSALYFAQRFAESADQRILQERFQSRVNYLFGTEEVRDAAVAQRCRELARSVRIRAALEENDIEDLYANAEIELRNLLDSGNTPPSDSSTDTQKASFFRFLTADGEPLPPPSGKIDPWEPRLFVVKNAPEGQQVGYVPIEAAGKTEISEIIATPILGAEAERIAYLVLGFRILGPNQEGTDDLTTGIWLNGQLYISKLSQTERLHLASGIGKFLISDPSENNFKVQIRGVPYLLFCKVLNPNSKLAPAYEICLYSLEASVTQQQRLRWWILGIGIIVLALGMAGSHFISARMARPVEQLEEVSAQNAVRRVEAEAALQLTEQKYRSIFENAVEGIFLLSPEGRYLSANPAMARIFGCESPDELLGDSFDRYVQREQGEEFLTRVKNEKTVSNFEFEALRADGQKIWVSQNAHAVRSASGELLHAEGTLQDITESRENQRKLVAAKSAAEAASRLKSEFLATMSHELRTPLNGVIGMADLLLMTELNPEQNDFAKTLRRSGESLLEVVSDILDFSKIEAGKLELEIVDFNLKEAIDSIVDLLGREANRKGIELTSFIKSDVPLPVRGDPGRLRQIINNLVGNAIKFTEQGEVLLSVFALADNAVTTKLRFEIRDTGIGIEAETQSKLFEAFTQADASTTRKFGGTGLGLAISKRLVHLMKGKIGVQSEVGKGSTFWFEVDLVKQEVKAKTLSANELGLENRQSVQAAEITREGMAKNASAVARPDSHGRNGTDLETQKIKILLAEDNPVNQKVSLNLLKKLGYRVALAVNGVEVLKELESTAYDLILMDCQMPEMDGYEATRRIRAGKYTQPRIVAVTANAMKGDDELCRAAGMDDYITKPLRVERLGEVIERWFPK